MSKADEEEINNTKRSPFNFFIDDKEEIKFLKERINELQREEFRRRKYGFLKSVRNDSNWIPFLQCCIYVLAIIYVGDNFVE